MPGRVQSPPWQLPGSLSINLVIHPPLSLPCVGRVLASVGARALVRELVLELELLLLLPLGAASRPRALRPGCSSGGGRRRFFLKHRLGPQTLPTRGPGFVSARPGTVPKQKMSPQRPFPSASLGGSWRAGIACGSVGTGFSRFWGALPDFQLFFLFRLSLYAGALSKRATADWIGRKPFLPSRI